MRKSLLIALLGCGGGGGGTPPPDTSFRPVILDVAAPSPLLVGSSFTVTVADLDAAGRNIWVQVGSERLEPEPLEREDSSALRVQVPAAALDVIEPGPIDVILRVGGDRAESDPFEVSAVLADVLPVELNSVPSGEVFRNELAVLSGAGFVEGTEGTIEAVFEGMFAPDDGGEATPVSASLSVAQAERNARDRGTVPLTTDIGGLYPGTFTGTLSLRSRLASGAESETDPQDVEFHFQPPAVFGLDQETTKLEELVRVRGGGFLGEGLGGEEEVTQLSLDGRFFPTDGPMVTVSDRRGVPVFFSGSQLGYVIQAEPLANRLVASLFGSARGRFEGTLTPIVSSPQGELTGAGAPITVELTGVRQVVWLRFLPGFYDVLPRFGIAAAAGRIEELARDRIERIYERWAVDVRLERPDDVSPAGLAILEIGGPDPNGRGLFGYDNSPGKDIGNLRLSDRIGGDNATTRQDGFPSYGGVFMISFLGFSSHPEIELGPGPAPDPLFDEIFDPVRSEPATLAEVRGVGERAAVVDRAVRAFASMIGETTAHELGHSVGMADPFGSPTVFHNRGNGEGCVMDSGSARPFGERTEQEGFAESRFCGDNAVYLDEILGL